ncbi:MAG: two-component regulator propeller domain-containing protein [Taibaiella sp.]|jgi:signal transduction histidine kinase/streptogramin lyase
MKQHLFQLFLFLLLVVVDASAQKATDFSVTHYTNENGLPQNSIKGIEMDKNGFLWMATESGILRFDGQQFKLYDRNHFPLIKSNRVGFMGLTKDSLIFFFDEDRNYFSFNKQQKLICSESYTDAKATIVKGPDAYDPIVKLNFGKIKGKDEGFVASADQVFYISGKKKIWTRYFPDGNFNILNATGKLNEKLYYLNKQFKIKSVDRNGIIKKVSLKGIDQILKAANPYPYNYCFFQQEEALYLLIGKGIYQLHESGEQELTADLVLETDAPGIFTYRNYPSLNLHVLGSLTHGLYLYRKKQFKALRHTNGYGNFYPQAVYQDSGVLTTRGLIYPSSSKFNYPFDIITLLRGLLRDSRGHYWMNGETIRKGESFHITELDEHLKIVKRYRGWKANCFRETPDGTIWISQFKGNCMGKISGDSIKWLPKLRSGRLITTFLPENNDEFWIGGTHTFAKLNVRTGKEQHYKSLEQITVETLYLDPDKVLWIGATGNGFFALKQNKVYQLPLDVKNNLSNVHAFMEDKNGFMWMSTNNGLFRCKKEDLENFIDRKTTTVYYQYFSKDAGFNTNEFNGSCTPSAIVLGNGKFSFPSLDGLVQFYPDSIRELLPTAKIFIDKLLVDGKKQDLSKTQTLDPSFKRLEIEVASPFYGNPANQQIEYNVKGLDQNWYPVKNDNVVTLNNLPYGKYSLQFRKRAGFGSNNIITTALPFTVSPFYYQTWYFRSLILALVAFMLFLTIKIRYTYLLKRNRQLEVEVAQRTIHLKNANKLKEKLLLMVGHDLRSPLHFLGILAQDVRHSVANGEQDKISSAAEEIHDTTRKLHAFVEEFSLWARLQDEQYNLRKRNFPISDLLEELRLFFEETLQAHNNSLELSINENQELYTNPELLKAILRNLIDNANKHTRDGHIRISWQKNNDTGLQLCISDTGNGMSLLELNNIRRRIQQFQEPTAIKPGSQLGYQLIIDFAARLDLALHIDSEKGRGTTVTIHGIQVHNSSRQPGSLPAETVDRG